MKNMVDYVRSAHEPFSDAPFSKVDSLVLSELAYLRYEACGLADEPARQLTLKRLSREGLHLALFAHIHTKTQLWELVRAVGASPRFSSLIASHYAAQTDIGEGKQFSATTYLFEKEGLYIAFRGTDTSMAGWKENLNMAYMPVVPSQQAAVDYLDAIARKHSGPLYVGGHSKGGNLAVYAAAHCDSNIQDRIVAVYNHDGPGFHRELFQQPGYHRVKGRISRTVPEESVIGLLLGHDVPYKVIASKERGILQHSAMSWVIHDGLFFTRECVDQEALGFAACLNDWLDSLDLAERKTIVNILFQIISTSSPLTLYEIFRAIVRKTPLSNIEMSHVAPEARQLLAEKAYGLQTMLADVREKTRHAEPNTTTTQK